MRLIIPALVAVAAAGCAALATPGPALANANEEAGRPWGSITFRSERYGLSDRAVVTTTPTTIRIADDSATTQQGKKTSLYVQLGYSLDASKPNVIRVSSGVAVRGYDFATGTYDESQAIQIGPGTLSIDSPNWSEATHAWGHLNSPNERGIDLDVHGVHFANPS